MVSGAEGMEGRLARGWSEGKGKTGPGGSVNFTLIPQKAT